jgi:hypothetical protein
MTAPGNSALAETVARERAVDKAVHRTTNAVLWVNVLT